MELKKRQREEEEKKQREEEERRRVERESEEIFPLSIEVPVVNLETNHTEWFRVYTSQETTEQPLQQPTAQSSEQPTTQSTKQPTEQPTKQPTEQPTEHPIEEPSDHETQTQPTSQYSSQTMSQCPTSNRFFTEPSQVIREPNHTHNQSNDLQSKKKLPKTTARRKGVYVPKKDRNVGVEGDDSVERPKRNIKRLEGVTIESEEDEDESVDEDFLCSEEEDISDGDEDQSMVDDVSDEEEELSEGTHPFDIDVNGLNDDPQGDEQLKSVYKNGKMYTPKRWGEIVLKPWLMFMSKAEFLLVLSENCVQEGFSVVVLKSEKYRYRAECSGRECTWTIHASCLPDKMTWAIKTILGVHKECFNVKKNPMATVPWMAKKLQTELRANPNMPVKSMMQLLMNNFGIEVCKRTMYKVRIAAATLLTGGEEESYNSLAAYGEMIKITNPGSWSLITWHNPQNNGAETHFKSMFVSFSSWIVGFLKGCRPLIGVDGCHLKGRYKGMLLSALGLDGNNNLFLIAYAIVGKENTETWSYFFRNLKIAFQKYGCLKWDWTFISDRMKGVERALEKEFPQAVKRICAQHLYSNFKNKWGGPAFHDLFWTAAHSTSAHVYNNALNEIGKLSQGALAYLLSVPQQWSKHQFDPEVACDHNTSNFVESFNALINDLREKPVLTLMEGIRTYYMDKFAERMGLADIMQMEQPTPYAKEIVESNCIQSRQCMVISAGGGEFEVYDGYRGFPVDILKGTCVCGGWQITGLPCKHACRAIYHNKEEPSAYVNGFYRGHCYKLTYKEHMHPIPDKEAWPSFQFPRVLPPIPERSIGRPARQRKRKPDEPSKGKRSKTVTCSICKTVGHNSRSCKGGPTAKESQAARGSGQNKKSRTDGASTSNP